MSDPATRLAELEREIRVVAMQVFGETSEFAVDDVRKMGLLLRCGQRGYVLDRAANGENGSAHA